MARTESRTKTSIWTNPDFCALDSRSQRLYWLLFSQPTISLCGVVALTVTRWTKTSSDETVETIAEALEVLEETGFIVVDRESEEVFVRSFMRNDGVVRSPKTYLAAKDQAAAIMSGEIRRAVEAEFDRIDTLSDTPPDTPSTMGRDTLSDTPPDRPRGRARAVSVSSLQSPSPSPSPVSAPDDDRDGTGSSAVETGTETLGLVGRLAGVCAGRNRQRVNLEAIEVVAWARHFVADQVIDEAIGYAGGLDEKPALPRAVASIVRSKAADHGIRMPEFQPTVRAVS